MNNNELRDRVISRDSTNHKTSITSALLTPVLLQFTRGMNKYEFEDNMISHDSTNHRTSVSSAIDLY